MHDLVQIDPLIAAGLVLSNDDVARDHQVVNKVAFVRVVLTHRDFDCKFVL